MDPALQELWTEGLPDDEVAVLIRLVDPAHIPDGVRIVVQFGAIATCRLRRGDIVKIRGQPQIASMKRGARYSRPFPEFESAGSDADDESEVESGIQWSDQRRPDGKLPTGAGTAVAHIDWGLDFGHVDFRNPDGSTRVLALWDQSREYDPRWPNPYGYGRIYTAADINHALATEDPYATLGLHPAKSAGERPSHGTHTTGISAGNGRSGGPVGLAPEASIIFVHLATASAQDPLLTPSDAEFAGNLGDSVGFIEGLDFIRRAAGDLPVVINASIGRIAGEHDGRALTVQGMDAFLSSGPGTAIVNSAGNYFDREAHACGKLWPGQQQTLRFILVADSAVPTELDLWYSGDDRFSASVRAPGSDVQIRAIPGERVIVTLDGREGGRLYHRLKDPNNNDNQITLFLDRGATAGQWELTLTGEVVVDGRFHAWIERTVAKPSERAHFHPDDADPTTTLGTICDGLRTIAVGAIDAHQQDWPLARFSSCGPERRGRWKPDLVAPGVKVLSARSRPLHPTPDTPLQARMSGTSMSTPHVAGTIALMFAAAGRHLDIDETRTLLLSSCDPIPPDADRVTRLRLGKGYLNVEAAVEAARRVGQAAAKETDVNEYSEANLRREGPAFSGRPRGGVGGGLPFQVQVPLTGGPPALALPFGGAGSPLAFTVPIGGTPPLPQTTAPAPQAPPPPTKASTPPSDDPPITVASVDVPIDIPPAESFPEDQPFGAQVLALAEGLDEVSVGGSDSSAVLASLVGGLGSMSASALFKRCADSAPLVPGLARRILVLARPNDAVGSLSLNPGDLLLRVARGESWGRVAVVASGGLYRREDLAGAGLRGEGHPRLLAGHYVHVVEPCTASRTAASRFARRLANDRQRVLPDTLVLRLMRLGESAVDSSGADSSAEQDVPAPKQRPSQALVACPHPIGQTVGGFTSHDSAVTFLPDAEKAKIRNSADLITASFQPGCNPLLNVGLVGHADRDPKSGADFENRISTERAQSVRRALEGYINNPEILGRITWQMLGAGADSPLVPSPKNETERARNRRVEIFLGPIPLDGVITAVNVDSLGAAIRFVSRRSQSGELALELYRDSPGPAGALLPRTEWMRRGAMLGLAQRAFFTEQRTRLFVSNDTVQGIEVYKA